jgi:hypothetical protein
VLTELNDEADDPTWVRGLLMVFSSPDRDQQRMNQMMERWEQQLGHTDWIEWLATETTHEVLLEWRELVSMQQWLDDLPAELEAFEEVATERKRRAAEARRLLHDEQLLNHRDALSAEITSQNEQIQVLKAAVPEADDQWMLSIAGDDQRALVRELSAMQALVHKGMKPAEQARWQARIARLRGVLFWQLVESSASRIRELEGQLRQNQRLLADLNNRITEVQSAEAEFAAGVETDFITFADRAKDLIARVDTARENRELALAAEIKRGMQREMREVQQYLLVTRIAIARATDQLALTSSEGGE